MSDTVQSKLGASRLEQGGSSIQFLRLCHAKLHDCPSAKAGIQVLHDLLKSFSLSQVRQVSESDPLQLIAMWCQSVGTHLVAVGWIAIDDSDLARSSAQSRSWNGICSSRNAVGARQLGSVS